ncbi:MAG: hypothetical protein IK990_06180 [Ruminiclostridium sp.]|nr:hypothetical protein [Ruminiclostridium sp.]
MIDSKDTYNILMKVYDCMTPEDKKLADYIIEGIWLTIPVVLWIRTITSSA